MRAVRRPRRREHPLVRLEAPGEAVGQPVAAEKAAQCIPEGHGAACRSPTAPIAFSRRAIRYCSSGTRSPNSSR